MPRRIRTGPPEGLRYIEDFLSTAEERALVEALDALAFHKVEMRGVVARREVLHFGWDYGYESWRIAPTVPLPDFLQPLRARSATVMGVEPEALEEALVSRYPPGAGIGWHRDAPMFGPEVVGISLRSACPMRFRRRVEGGFEAFTQPLAPRSLYVLGGAARAEWQHSIPGVEALRYSVTFRTVRAARALPRPASDRSRMRP